MNGIDSTIFWLRLAQLLVAIPLLAIAGQGAVFILARMMGQAPAQNFFYRVLEVVASPVVKVCRWITPRIIADRHVPLAAFSLLLVGYFWVMLAIANACIAAGLPIGQCLNGH
ncbi:MAG: hypothetical protein ABI724_18545 [Betaproteobacteria bacterium]